MEIKKTGIILYTEHFEATVEFYKKIFDLPILYTKENLVCLDFKESYLMIELDDEQNLKNTNSESRAKFCIRFNVDDVKKACVKLDENAVPYDYYEFDWGKLAKFKDPDGNFVGIRSTKEHEEDIKRNQKD